MRTAPLLPGLALLLPLLAGCPGGDDDDSAAADDDSTPADDDTTAADDDSTPSSSSWCEEEGLTVRPFDASATAPDFDGLAADFTTEELDRQETRSFTFSEAFSGCDSYVFFVHDSGSGYSEAMLDPSAGDVEDLFGMSPRNVHYFFLSWENDDDDARADVEELRSRINGGLARLEEEEQDYWKERLHYVIESGRGLGWIGEFLDSYDTLSTRVPPVFAIDRFQVVREPGYMADPNTGWSTVPIWFAAYEPRFFNFESDRADAQALQGATVLRAFDQVPASDPGWAGISIYADVAFPDAAAMAGFDTMELDLTMACAGHPDAEQCPEWDYLVYAYLCEPDDPDTCDTEIGRWITTYARPGRWVTDASAFLALLRDGGTRRFRFYTTQYYVITLDVRLSDGGKPTGRPYELVPLWTGGSFDAAYNDAHPPIPFTPPAGTTRVELFALISGHGYGNDRANCAEFCNHQHEFTVNGAEAWLEEYPEAGSAYGCADQVADGVVPGQYGTWVYGRGGWCPGLEVQPFRADLTSAVTVGAENTLSYRGLFQGEPYVPEAVAEPSGFGARIDLTSWLVYWR